MSRFLTSIGILLGLTVLSTCSLLLLRSECNHYTQLTEAVTAAYAQGDTAAALACFDALEDEWEHFHNMTGLFVDGGKLDAIYSHITLLRPLLAQGCPEAAGELESIRMLTQGLYEEELPKLWHIL